MAEEKKLEELQAELAEAKKSIEALSAKNRELLDEKRSTKTGAERQLAEAQDRIEELSGQLDAMKRDHEKQTKALAKERDDARAALEGETAATARLLIDGGLTSELAKIGVKPEHLPALKAYLATKLSVETEGAERKAVAVVKDAAGKESKVGVADFLKTWAASDEGKAYIPAGANRGAGAGGPGQPPAGKTKTRAEFDALDPAAKMEFSKAGGQLTE